MGGFFKRDMPPSCSSHKFLNHEVCNVWNSLEKRNTQKQGDYQEPAAEIHTKEDNNFKKSGGSRDKQKQMDLGDTQ